MKVKDTTKKLKIDLECSQYVLASFIGLTSFAIARNGKTDILTSKTKTAKRILALSIVVERLVAKGISGPNIKSALLRHVYGDLDGNFDSVVTAIQQNKYPTRVLMDISDLGLRAHLKSEYTLATSL